MFCFPQKRGKVKWRKAGSEPYGAGAISLLYGFMAGKHNDAMIC